MTPEIKFIFEIFNLLLVGCDFLEKPISIFQGLHQCFNWVFVRFYLRWDCQYLKRLMIYDVRIYEQKLGFPACEKIWAKCWFASQTWLRGNSKQKTAKLQTTIIDFAAANQLIQGNFKSSQLTSSRASDFCSSSSVNSCKDFSARGIISSVSFVYSSKTERRLSSCWKIESAFEDSAANALTWSPVVEALALCCSWK